MFMNNLQNNRQEKLLLSASSGTKLVVATE